MKTLSYNILHCDTDLTRLLNYLQACKEDEPFTMRQIYEDQPYYLRMDKDGFTAISLARSCPAVLNEDKNTTGYARIRIKNEKILKHRLIYKMFGKIPDYLDIDNMDIHHINLNKCDNRLENLYPIRKELHRVLHKYIDKYGIENVEI